MVIGKSNINQENYDILIKIIRNEEVKSTNISIPNYIEIIDSYSLNELKFASTIESTDDSKLRVIENGAFVNLAFTYFE